jgi:signal transduction histidine kinase
MTTAIADTSQLIDRLAAHRTLGAAPREELAWLAAHGEARSYQVGDVVAAKGDYVSELVVIFSGRIAVYFERAGGRRRVLESYAGDASGLLPYSRMVTAVGTVLFEEAGEVLALHHDLFPEMIRECPTITSMLVHVMLDRSRQFVATDWQDEKLTSLGKLAAGLSHELNNPASAATRGARLLGEMLTEVGEAAQALGAENLTEMQRQQVATLRMRCLLPSGASAIERSEREDDISSWLEAHGANLSPAAGLADSGVTLEQLNDVAESLQGRALDAALRWCAAEYSARALAIDVQNATHRIYNLVSAVKRFTLMDRATVAEPIDISQGIADAISVMSEKAREKAVTVRLELQPEMPLVTAFAAELNQVWANLLENALDAVSAGGDVLISLTHHANSVTVSFLDNGPGIPAAVVGQVFDPFFTTKPVGEGMGLGLHIASRIIRAHNGQINVESVPGRTEFRVLIPVHPSTA